MKMLAAVPRRLVPAPTAWLALAVLLGFASATDRAAAHKGERMDLSALVPESLGEWRAAGADGSYDRKTIFKYMDGAGEVYLSFGFRELFVRPFTREDETVTAELYDMGLSEEAYGIFSRNRRGENAGIGQGSEYQSGHLIFWKARYLVAVFGEKESAPSKEAIFGLAKAIAARIEGTGSLPHLVSLLPQQDLIELSVRYFHKHTDLNEHYFVADDNILDLDEGTNATIANYSRAGSRPFLLVIQYPDAGRASAAYGRFLDLFMPEGRDSGIACLEDGLWTAVARTGVYIEAVFDAPTRTQADSLLSQARNSIGGMSE